MDKGIPALFTAKLNPLLFPFLKKFAVPDLARDLSRHSENFPRRLSGGVLSAFCQAVNSFVHEYYDIVKNLPELRRFFATFF
jgi:hypothetical protein